MIDKKSSISRCWELVYITQMGKDSVVTTRCWYIGFGRYYSIDIISLYPENGKGFVFHIPSLGNVSYHADGKGKQVYITKMVYHLREISHGDGKRPVWNRV